MDQITIAFAFADTEAAQQLAAGLRTCGFVVQEDTEAGALSSGAKASSRCTIIIWSEASCDSSFVNDRAVRAAFRNVVVPLRSREFPLQSIPAAYRRVRPNILPGLPLIIPDNRTELGVFAD